MAGTLRIEDLDKLSLVWLLVPRKKPSLRSLANTLAPFLQESGAAPESIARQCLARLKTRREIEGDTTWMLSPGGREKALAVLGVPALPKRPSWKGVYNLLVARGQGVEATPVALRRVAKPDGLAAAVLEKHHRLQAPSRSELSLSKVGHALAWRELGVESTEPFSLKAVLSHIVQKTCGPAAAPRDSRAALAMLAAAALDVPRGDAPLRAALVQRWMEAPATLDAPAAIPPAAAVAPDDAAALRAFSRRALEAARASPTGRWGEHKVFVSRVWDEYQRRGGGSVISLEAFKLMLVRANQGRLLSLSRADLVEEMDAEDVRRSEIASLGATFHFVRID
jgi:hypothetical protein